MNFLRITRLQKNYATLIKKSLYGSEVNRFFFFHRASDCKTCHITNCITIYGNTDLLLL